MIRERYRQVITALAEEYQQAGLALSSDIPDAEVSSAALAQIRRAYQSDTVGVRASSRFKVASGPLTPDHIVYARSYPLTGKPTPQAVDAYRAQYGYAPRILIWGKLVYGVAATDGNAALALELAQDACFVEQLATAFGGTSYLTERARAFIDSWEAESYRRTQIHSNVTIE